MGDVSRKIRVFDSDNKLICFAERETAARLIADGAEIHGRGRRGYIRVRYSQAVEVERFLIQESRNAGKCIRGPSLRFVHNPKHKPQYRRCDGEHVIRVEPIYESTDANMRVFEVRSEGRVVEDAILAAGERIEFLPEIPDTLIPKKKYPDCHDAVTPKGLPARGRSFLTTRAEEDKQI